MSIDNYNLTFHILNLISKVTFISECESSLYKKQKLEKFENSLLKDFKKFSVGIAIIFTKWVRVWLGVVAVVMRSCSSFMWFKEGVHSLWIQKRCFFISCVIQESVFILCGIQMRCSSLVNFKGGVFHLMWLQEWCFLS